MEYKDWIMEKFLEWERASEIDEQMGRLKHKAALAMDGERARRERAAALAGLSTLLEGVPAYLAEGDPQEVNRMLHLLIERIVVFDEDRVKIDFL